MGWLTGWGYRKSHVINYAAGAGTLYQKQITVHYGSGTDSDDDVYLNSHCRTDFGDVRFTDDDGSTLLDCWMESKVDSDNAVFWVEVADDLSSSNATIYVYYGKSDATTTSNFANTFIDTNDFEGDTVDSVPAGWTEDTPATGETIRVKDTASYIMHGSKGTQVKAAGTTSSKAWRTITTINADKNRAIEFWYKCITDQTGYYHCIYLEDGTTTKFYMAFRNGYIAYHTPTAWVNVQTYSTGTWYRIKIYNIDFTNQKFDMDIDGVNKVAGGTFYAAATQFTRFAYYSGGSTTPEYAFDTFFIRKCVSPEPSHGSWGSEETGGAILKEVADSLSLSDSLLCNKTFTVTDSIGLADTPLKDWSPQVADAVALSDSILRDKTFTISDSISLTDAVYKILTQYITDQISLADTIQTDKQLLITDAVALSDAIEVIGGAIIKYVTDVIGLSDLVSTPQKAVIIQDLINLLDQITVTGPAVPTPLGGGRVITWTPIRIKEQLTPEEKPKLEVIPQPLPAGMTFEELVAYAHNMLQPLKVTEEELKRILQPVLQLLPKNERQKEELQALRELLASLKFERESVEDSLRKILQNVKVNKEKN